MTTWYKVTVLEQVICTKRVNGSSSSKINYVLIKTKRAQTQGLTHPENTGNVLPIGMDNIRC